MCDRHDRQATAPHGDARFAESHQNHILQLVSSLLETHQSYSWYHHSWRRVSHTAGDASDTAFTSLPRTHVWAHGLALRPWHLARPGGCLLHLVAMLPLPLLFRFDVLVTIYLYDSL